MQARHLFFLVLMLTVTLGGSLALRCSRPRPPRNGDVHVVNDTATFSCKSSEGYVLSGSPTSVCQPGWLFGYTWTGKVPKCRKRYCARLLEPEHGYLNLTRYLAFFRCQDGFRLVGSRNRTCLNNGTNAAHWSGLPVWCSPCAAPPAVKGGFLVEEDGLTAKYACKRRHSLIGNSTILCNASSSTWASPATCLKTGCPDLHHPLNGVVHYNKKLLQVHYTCNQGYLLFGSPHRSCNETTSKWSGSRPSCTTSDVSMKRFKHCGVLEHPLFGQVSFDKVSYTKLEATYTCNPGFFRHGNEKRICISYRQNQKWSGSTAKCLPCPPISEHLRNGRVTVSRNRAYYTCDHGYNLKGPTIRRCNRRTHRWSNSPPRCTHFCRLPNSPLEGSVLIDGFFANYSCISGHRLVGSSSIQCVSGKWVSDPPSCVLGCSTDLSIENGYVYINGSVAVYSCKSGYRLAKESKRHCKKYSWKDAFYWYSSREPWCTRCQKPDAPKNGRVTERENEATHDCDYKFALLGVETLTCNESGKWSAPAPVCKKPKCGLLKIDYNQRVTYSEINGTLKATFTCRYGKNLFGDKTKICNANDMRWRGLKFDVQLPTCSLCPFLELDNGNVVQDGVSATYSCNDGFRLVGSRTRTCGEYSGKWSGCPPVCSEDGSGSGSGDESDRDFFSTCCSPPNPPNGSVVLTSPRKGIRLAHYFCNNGFRLIGRGHTRECSSSFNFWFPSFEPSCTSTCPSLSNPRNGEVLVNGSRAVYSCHAPLILYGNKERLCSNVTRQWIGESPVCLRESSPTSKSHPSSCPPPPDLVNGQVKILSDFFPFSVGVNYACNDGYRLVGISDNYCSDREWLAPVPFCSVCPPPPRLPNEFVQEIGSVATYICSDWDLFMFGDATITCNAITKKWSESKRSCVSRSCLHDYNVPPYGQVKRSLNPTFIETFSCYDGFEIVGEPVRRCINGSWNGPLPTCKQILSDCTKGETKRDECNRLCTCKNSSWSCCRERMEFTSMTVKERRRYIQTVLNATTNPKFSNFLKATKEKFERDLPGLNLFSPLTFLFSQRQFLTEYEDFLQKIDCRVTVPYWDWSVVAQDPYRSSVWGEEDYQLGGDGVGKLSCVQTGPFRAEIYSFGHGRCVERNFSGTFPGPVEISRLLSLPADRFEDLELGLRINFDLSVRCLIGGTMCSHSAFYTPEFSLHAAFIDKLLRDWEGKNSLYQGDGPFQTAVYQLRNSSIIVSDSWTKICYRDGAKSLSVEELERFARKSFSDLSPKALSLMKAGKKEIKKANEINEFLHLGTKPLRNCTVAAERRDGASRGCLPLS